MIDPMLLVYPSRTQDTIQRRSRGGLNQPECALCKAICLSHNGDACLLHDLVFGHFCCLIGKICFANSRLGLSDVLSVGLQVVLGGLQSILSRT